MCVDICMSIDVLGVAISNYYELHFSSVKSTLVTKIYVLKKENILKRIHRISNSVSKGKPMLTLD